ncbi:MAG: hypothetical protein Q9182_005933 [Xanthomendoza sp. 2 TL-2023]
MEKSQISQPDEAEPTEANLTPSEASGLLNCPIGRLPTEIRLIIYDHVFHSTQCSLVWMITPQLHRTALLRTCRVIYDEAAELLYRGKTIIVNRPRELIDLAKLVQPQHFDQIRHIHMVFQGWNFQIRHSQSDLFVADWTHLWKMVTGIQCLQTLRIHLDLHSAHFPAEHCEICCQLLLRPLLNLGGLQVFDLVVYSTMWDVSWYESSWMSDKRPTSDTMALLRKIREEAKKPRTGKGPTGCAKDGSRSDRLLRVLLLSRDDDSI